MTSPERASLDSVVLTDARPSPVAEATSLAVSAWPSASASALRTAFLVPPAPPRAELERVERVERERPEPARAPVELEAREREEVREPAEPAVERAVREADSPRSEP